MTTFNTTNVFSRNLDAITSGKRTIINQGGTSSSKTYSIIQLLIIVAIYSPVKRLISIVSESLPHLKRGCLRDFEQIMGDSFDQKRMNKTDHIYNFGNARIEFFSADVASKLRGGRRDILYINEVNNIPKKSYDELDVRTREYTVVDFNPVESFYIHDLIGSPGVEFIKSTYLDAAHVLPPETVRSIEARKERDPNWWKVYGLGEIGSTEGLIYPCFDQIDEMPDVPTTIGVDFGYTNDPTAIVNVGIDGDAVYIDEIEYSTGLTNNMISRVLSAGYCPRNVVIYADSAEPKSIAELHGAGHYVKPAVKGPDSVMAGIDYIKRYRLKVTKRSLNVIKELRSYRWQEDKNGKLLNIPVDLNNHALDAVRYALSYRIKPLPLARAGRAHL